MSVRRAQATRTLRKQRQGPGTQPLLLAEIADLNAELRAIAEMLLDDVPQVVHRDILA
jgi:hypothetical protein